MEIGEQELQHGMIMQCLCVQSSCYVVISHCEGGIRPLCLLPCKIEEGLLGNKAIFSYFTSLDNRRYVASLGEDGMHTTMAGGNSGRPLSRYYDSDLEV